MATIFNIPQLGPLKFYHQSDVWNTEVYTNATYNGFNPQFNFRNFDQDFYYRNLKAWEDKIGYIQPWQKGDVLCFMWEGVASGVTGPYHVRFVNCWGQVIKTVAATLHGAISGGNYLWYFKSSLWDLPEGIYYVQILHNGFGGDKDYFMISEPIDVKQYHPNTSLIRGWNSYNDQGVYFEVSDIKFELRVHGCLTELETNSQFNVYEDQPLNLQLLSSTPYREWKFDIGVGNKPIPDHFRDKLERFMGLDNLMVNGLYITRLEGAKFEVDRIEKHPLKTISINVREKINDQSIEVTDYFHFSFGKVPDTEWFYVVSIQNSAPLTGNIKKQFNGLANFLDYLNKVYFVSTHDENNYFYANEFGEIFLKTNDPTAHSGSAYTWQFNCYTNYVELEYEAVNTDTITLSVTSNPTTLYYALFSDVMDATPSEGNGTNLTITHTFTGAKNDVLRCYFGDNLHNVEVTSTAKLKTLGGILGASLLQFELKANDLKKVKPTLLNKSNASYIGLIDLSGNKLSTGEVDKLIMMCYDHQDAFDLGSSAVVLDSQTPTAPPTDESGLQLILEACQANGVGLQTD